MDQVSPSEPRAVKSLVCERLGNPARADLNVLHVAQLPVPALSPNAVRIRVEAAGLNYADALQVQGLYQEKPRLPFVPGSECSGVLTEVGRDVLALRPGDQVCAVTQGGAFAEEVTAPALCVVKLPASCDLEAAAGLPVAFGTAYLALRDRADVQPGQTVLVLGAAGGVGLAAVQLARVMGARVVAVAREPANGRQKMEALRLAGADACINLAGRKPEQLRSLVRAVAPTGVDVVFDPVGGTLATEALRCARWGAHILVIGFASGVPAIPANLALVKNLTLHGVYWGAHMQHRPHAFRRSLEEVARLYAAGDIAVHVSHRYALEQASEAFSVLLNRGVVGKLLMLPGPRSML